MRHSIQLGILLLILSFSCGKYTAGSREPQPPAVVLSQQLLDKQRAGESVVAIVDELAAIDPQALLAELDTREEKLAFWVNTYNGMVQYLLSTQPELWEDRRDFFSGKRITVAGELMSLEGMEHGIIRGTEGKLGLGFIPKLFPSKFERTFKIRNGDPRIHFALNCGAIDCPPVEVYDPATVDQRLDYRSRTYLEKHSTISDDGKTITTTPLFKWFKGDFGTYGGIDDFLVHFGIVAEENKRIKREYKDYDWTLALDVWAED